MSYDLKKLKGAMDEHIPPLTLNKERIMDEVREIRPVQKGKVTRIMTLIAACIVLILALGSLILPTLGEHPDHIDGQEYYLNNQPINNEPHPSLQEVLSKLTMPPNTQLEQDNVGRFTVSIVSAALIYFVARMIYAAKKKKLCHILLTEVGMLVYLLALAVCAYRPSVGDIESLMEIDKLHRGGGVQWIYYGVQLFPVDMSVQGAYAMAIGWSAVCVMLTASMIASYSWMRRRWVILLTMTLALIAPWAWKAICLDMTAANWRMVFVLMGVVIPLGAVVLYLIPFTKRLISRYALWCTRFDDDNAYGRLPQDIWWVMLGAAVLNLYIGSLYSGQELEWFKADVKAEYGISEVCDKEWIETVNKTYGLYQEALNAGVDASRVDEIFADEIVMTENAVRAMVESGIDQLTSDMILTVEINAEFQVKRPIARGMLFLKRNPLSEYEVLWEGVEGSNSVAGTNAERQSLRTTSVFLVKGGISPLTEAQLELYIKQASVSSLDLVYVRNFPSVEGYVAQFDFDENGVNVKPESINERESVRFVWMCLGVALLILNCFLKDFIGERRARARMKGKLIEFDIKMKNILRWCLAGTLGGLLLYWWAQTDAATSLVGVLGRTDVVYSQVYLIGINVAGKYVHGGQLTDIFCILTSLGLIRSIWTLISPRHVNKRHWDLLVFEVLELALYTGGMFIEDMAYQCLLFLLGMGATGTLIPMIFLGVALVLTIWVNVQKVEGEMPKDKAERRVERRRKIESKQERAAHISGKVLGILLIVLLICSWYGASSWQLGGLPYLSWMNYFEFMTFYVTSGWIGFTMNMLITAGVIWSIVLLLQGKEKYHWWLTAFLFVEAVMQGTLGMLNIMSEKMFIPVFMIASCALALVWNLYLVRKALRKEREEAARKRMEQKKNESAIIDPAPKYIRILRKVLAVVLTGVLAVSWLVVMRFVMLGKNSSDWMCALSFPTIRFGGAYLRLRDMIWLTLGIGWSVRTFWKERGQGKMHWMLHLFLLYEIEGLFSKESMVLSVVWGMALFVDLHSFNASRKNAKPAKRITLGKVGSVILGVLLVLSNDALSVSLGAAAGEEAYVAWLHDMGFFIFKALPSLVDAWRSPEWIILLSSVVLSLGVIWSIWELWTEQDKGKRHWMLCTFLVMEGLIHVIVWLDYSDLEQWIGIAISTVLIWTVAGILLWRNIQQMRLEKWQERITTPKPEKKIAGLSAGKAALWVIGIVLVDILSLVLTFVEFYLVFTLDYEQKEILDFLNGLAVVVPVVCIALFALSIFLRVRLKKRNAGQFCGLGLLTTPTLLISILMLLFNGLFLMDYVSDFMMVKETGTFRSGAYTYFIQKDGTAQITGYLGMDKEVVIPEELDGSIVTSIREDAFYNNRRIVSVTIPNTVTNVEGSPFAMCLSLREIKVSSEHPVLEVVDGVLFDKNEKSLLCMPYGLGITEYVIPEGTKLIGDKAFYYCRSLTDVSIPDSVTQIGSHAFAHCDGLIEVYIPDSVTWAEEGVFSSCGYLENVRLSPNMHVISDEMFQDCDSLTELVLPYGVTIIGQNAFGACSNLTTVEFPKGLWAIREYAFTDCVKLTNLYLPTRATDISDSAFVDCEELMLLIEADAYARDYQEWYAQSKGIEYSIVERKGEN